MRAAAFATAILLCLTGPAGAVQTTTANYASRQEARGAAVTLARMDAEGRRGVFAQWKADIGRTYSTLDQENRRFRAWSVALNDMVRHNLLPSATWFRGLNHFSDLPWQQFRDERLMADASVAAALEKIKDAPLHELGREQPPAAWDWRDEGVMPAVRDQRPCGAGWAHASVAALEAAAVLDEAASAGAVDLSEQQMLDCVTTHAGYSSLGCKAGHADEVFRHAATSYLAPESLIPYTGRDGGACAAPSEAPQGAVKAYSPAGFVRVADSTAALMDAVASQGPVVTYMNVLPELVSFTGGVYAPTQCLTDTYNHAMLIIGYNATAGIGAPNSYWIFRNSWGADWGEQGHVRVQMVADSAPGGCRLFSGLMYAASTVPLTPSPSPASDQPPPAELQPEPTSSPSPALQPAAEPSPPHEQPDQPWQPEAAQAAPLPAAETGAERSPLLAAEPSPDPLPQPTAETSAVPPLQPAAQQSPPAGPQPAPLTAAEPPPLPSLPPPQPAPSPHLPAQQSPPPLPTHEPAPTLEPAPARVPSLQPPVPHLPASLQPPLPHPPASLPPAASPDPESAHEPAPESPEPAQQVPHVALPSHNAAPSPPAPEAPQALLPVPSPTPPPQQAISPSPPPLPPPEPALPQPSPLLPPPHPSPTLPPPLPLAADSSSPPPSPQLPPPEPLPPPPSPAPHPPSPSLPPPSPSPKPASASKLPPPTLPTPPILSSLPTPLNGPACANGVCPLPLHSQYLGTSTLAFAAYSSAFPVALVAQAAGSPLRYQKLQPPLTGWIKYTGPAGADMLLLLGGREPDGKTTQLTGRAALDGVQQRHRMLRRVRLARGPAVATALVQETSPGDWQLKVYTGYTMRPVGPDETVRLAGGVTVQTVPASPDGQQPASFIIHGPSLRLEGALRSKAAPAQYGGWLDVAVATGGPDMQLLPKPYAGLLANV
ncbi:hypothetical protein ABPG75_005566 [Micractinium tetrahymenae]